MKKKSTKPKTKVAKTISIFKLMEMFPTEQSAIDYVTKILWPDGAVCPYCKSREVSVRKQKNYYNCRDCRRDFTIRVGTIFHRSHLPMRTWLLAFLATVTERRGVSSLCLSKQLEITQKTAWFLLHRIRTACGNMGAKLLSGIVEADESHYGGLEKNKHEWKKLNMGRGVVGKQPVLVLRSRDGRVVAKTVKKVTRKALHDFVKANVAQGSTLCTDEHKGYEGLGKFYMHKTVKHSEKQYVNGIASVNGTESVNSILQKCYYGTYNGFSFRLSQYYVNEVVFRLNEGNCEIDTEDRINSLLLGMRDKRLTYQQLIAS